jgi:hypothetical protein
MGIRRKVYTCDCCGEEIIKTTWYGFINSYVSYYKIPHYKYFLKYGAHQKKGDIIICNDCFKDICNFVTEKRTVDFQVEVE